MILNWINIQIRQMAYLIFSMLILILIFPKIILVTAMSNLMQYFMEKFQCLLFVHKYTAHNQYLQIFSKHCLLLPNLLCDCRQVYPLSFPQRNSFEIESMLHLVTAFYIEQSQHHTCLSHIHMVYVILYRSELQNHYCYFCYTFHNVNI